MARINVAQRFTHEGAPAVSDLSAEGQLRRSVMACLLWEDTFYEDGVAIADRIVKAARAVSPETLATIAIEARCTQNLRHVPLLLLAVLTETGRNRQDRLVAETIEEVLSRADELAEFPALFWKTYPRSNKRKSLPKQMILGLRKAFAHFDEYQLAKYDQSGAVKLRDVLRLIHAKPEGEAQAALWKRVCDRTLKTPDTWEVSLSGGADKRETFERLIRDGKLGYLALLRNLRNMAQAGVDRDLVNDAIRARKGSARVLPFRYVAAARAAPEFEPALDEALQAAIKILPKLTGKTVVLVDVSGSMDGRMSGKSELTRADAAAALAAVINAEDLRVFSFSDRTKEVPARRGMAGIEAVLRSQPHSGTMLGAAVEHIERKVRCDRLIVITDEQSHQEVTLDPKIERAYLINVAAYQNGVGYGRWTHIDGFSEGVLRYIYEIENDWKAGV